MAALRFANNLSEIPATFATHKAVPMSSSAQRADGNDVRSAPVFISLFLHWFIHLLWSQQGLVDYSF